MHKIAVQTSPWFDWANPMQGLNEIKMLGFEAVDLNINTLASAGTLKKQEVWETVFDKNDEDLYAWFKPLKDAVEQSGVEICQMHAPFGLYAEGMPEFTNYMLGTVEQCIKICAYVGCPAIVVHPVTHLDPEKQWEINLGMYRRLMPFAKRFGVKICLENLFKRYNGRIIEGCCSEATEAVRYIDALNAEAGEILFGLCFDVGHANLLGRNLRKYLNIIGDRLMALHIHDNNCVDDLHLIPYTCTTSSAPLADWESFLAGLRDIGYQGEISFETFRSLNMMPREVHKQALGLIAAIGAYFRKRLQEEPENA